MSTKMQNNSALGPYRVLDLTDEMGAFCGKILGDLGADVIKVEKPGGDQMRNRGPFCKNNPNPDGSLFWLAYNANKRGITLDIQKSSGKNIFTKLVYSADFIIESFVPGYLDSLGLGYIDLSRINPHLVMTSISRFGQNGPKAHYAGSDLTSWASGGALWVCGDPDRPPNWISYPQASLIAGAEAAAASMIAHRHRLMTGEGQHVDVSVQECVTYVLHRTALLWDIEKVLYTRSGFGWADSALGLFQRSGFPCKDGYVYVLLMGGGETAIVNSSKALVRWMDEEDMAPEWLKSFDWVNEYDASKLTQAVVNPVEEAVASFLLTKTKEELYTGALARGVFITPVNDAADICKDQQLSAREYWVSIDHPEFENSLMYCGAFAKMSEAPLRLRRPAPRIGEHNEVIYVTELGLTRQEVTILRETGVI